MNPKEQLLTIINELNDEQLKEMARFAQVLLDEVDQVANYDPANDPMLNGEMLFEGAPDLSERVEDILYGDYQPEAKDKA